MAKKEEGVFIPIEIWEAPNLNWNEKALLAEIDSYTRNNKECYISNEYISTFLGATKRTAIRTLNSLIENGYLKRVKFDGKRRFLETDLDALRGDKNVTAEVTKMSLQGCQKCHCRGDKNVTPIPYNNNINNNIISTTNISTTIREDDVDKKENFVSKLPKSLDDFAEKYRGETIWKDVAFLGGFRKAGEGEIVKQVFEEFLLEQRHNKKNYYDYSEFSRHFLNYLRNRRNIKQKEETYGTRENKTNISSNKRGRTDVIAGADYTEAF